MSAVRKKEVSTAASCVASGDTVDTASTTSSARQAKLTELCARDKEKVANLIRELARLGLEKERAETALTQQRQASELQASERGPSALLVEQRRAMKGERARVQTQLQQCQDMLDKYEAFLAAQQSKWAQLGAGDVQHARSDTQRAGSDNLHARSAAQRAGNDTQRAVSDTQHVGSDTQRMGSDMQHAMSDMHRAGSDTQHVGSDTQHARTDAQHAGSDTLNAWADTQIVTNEVNVVTNSERHCDLQSQINFQGGRSHARASSEICEFEYCVPVLSDKEIPRSAEHIARSAQQMPGDEKLNSRREGNILMPVLDAHISRFDSRMPMEEKMRNIDCFDRQIAVTASGQNAFIARNDSAARSLHSNIKSQFRPLSESCLLEDLNQLDYPGAGIRYNKANEMHGNNQFAGIELGHDRFLASTSENVTDTLYTKDRECFEISSRDSCDTKSFIELPAAGYSLYSNDRGGPGVCGGRSNEMPRSDNPALPGGSACTVCSVCPSTDRETNDPISLSVRNYTGAEDGIFFKQYSSVSELIQPRLEERKQLVSTGTSPVVCGDTDDVLENLCSSITDLNTESNPVYRNPGTGNAFASIPLDATSQIQLGSHPTMQYQAAHQCDAQSIREVTASQLGGDYRSVIQSSAVNPLPQHKSASRCADLASAAGNATEYTKENQNSQQPCSFPVQQSCRFPVQQRLSSQRARFGEESKHFSNRLPCSNNQQKTACDANNLLLTNSVSHHEYLTTASAPYHFASAYLAGDGHKLHVMGNNCMPMYSASNLNSLRYQSLSSQVLPHCESGKRFPFETDFMPVSASSQQHPTVFNSSEKKVHPRTNRSAFDLPEQESNRNYPPGVVYTFGNPSLMSDSRLYRLSPSQLHEIQHPVYYSNARCPVQNIIVPQAFGIPHPALLPLPPNFIEAEPSYGGLGILPTSGCNSQLVEQSVAVNRITPRNHDNQNPFASDSIVKHECHPVQRQIVNGSIHKNPSSERSLVEPSSANQIDTDRDKFYVHLPLPAQDSTPGTPESHGAAVVVRVCANSPDDDIVADLLDSLLNISLLDNTIQETPSRESSLHLGSSNTRTKPKQTLEMGKKKVGVDPKSSSKQDVRFHAQQLQTRPQASNQAYRLSATMGPDGAAGAKHDKHIGGQSRVEQNRAIVEEDKLLADVFFTK